MPRKRPTAKTTTAEPARPSVAEARAEFTSTFKALRRAHPDAHCELNHQNPFELVVATVLSAQSTDVAVNQITPALFSEFPNPETLAAAAPARVEELLGKLGMFRQKTKNIIGLAQKLTEEHAGDVPQNLDDLVRLPGVGRKTANVVLGVAFGKPEGVVVDTHVQRVSQRLGWTEESKPDKIEADLMALAPKRQWDTLSHTIIFHGRRVCSAQRPACVSCAVNRRCPSAFHAQQVGRKASRSPTAATPAKPAAAKRTSNQRTSSKAGTKGSAARSTQSTRAARAKPKAP